MDNATKIQIIAAQYAGGPSDAIVGSFVAPAAIAVFYCICIVVAVGILIGIADGIIEYFSEKNNK
jgi:hypothetical protein